VPKKFFGTVVDLLALAAPYRLKNKYFRNKLPKLYAATA
jgi:hypothetical protein